MYKILNRTKNESIITHGNWPSDLLNSLLNNGNDVIVMSTYSNTIKVPFKVESNGETLWEWKEYRYDI